MPFVRAPPARRSCIGGGGKRTFCLGPHSEFGLITFQPLWRRRERRGSAESASRKPQRFLRKVTLKGLACHRILEKCWRRRESCPRPAKVSIRVTKRKSL